MNEVSKRGGRRPGAGRPGGPSEVVRLPLPLAAIAKRMKDGSLRAGDINAFLDVSAQSAAAVPLMSTSAACGFPSPADDGKAVDGVSAVQEVGRWPPLAPADLVRTIERRYRFHLPPGVRRPDAETEEDDRPQGSPHQTR